MLQSRWWVCLLIKHMFVESICALCEKPQSCPASTESGCPCQQLPPSWVMMWVALALMPMRDLHGAGRHSTDSSQKVNGAFLFQFPAFRKHQWLAGDEKLQTTEEKSAATILESREKRNTCSAWHTSFGHGFCLCCTWLQVRLASSGSTVTYGKECFKAMAAATLLRARLLAGGEEAAPAWAERAVGSVRSTASLQDFLFRYGNIPGHIPVQTGCHRTFFKDGFMGFSFLIITGIHCKSSPPASLLPILYVLSFPTLVCRHFSVRKSKKSTEFCTSDSFW